MTEQSKPAAPEASAAQTAPATSHAVVGPLTLRDLTVLGSIVVIFIASVIPLVRTIAGSLNLWNASSLFYTGIGLVLPLAVGGLFLARRLSPEVKVRFGSLSVDQFASVVASFSTFFFFSATVTNFGVAYLVGLIGSLAFLAATVCAGWIPAFASDFAGRAEAPAHRVALDAVPAVKRPAAAKPVRAQAPVAGQGPAAQAPAAQAFSQGQGTSQWAGPQSNTAHAPAGQIFTPAKDAVHSAQGNVSAAPAATAAAHSAAAPVTGTAVAAAAAAPGAGASATAATPAPSAAAAAPAATVAHPIVANDSAQASTPAAADQASGAARSSTEATTATTLNPQVATPIQEERPVRESISATVDAPAAVVADPFWFAVDRPQNVIDEKTRKFAFKLLPGSWILALEDRGNSFLVQDSHGKTGVLLDLVGIERASDSQ